MEQARDQNSGGSGWLAMPNVAKFAMGKEVMKSSPKTTPPPLTKQRYQSPTPRALEPLIEECRPAGRNTALPAVLL